MKDPLKYFVVGINEFGIEDLTDANIHDEVIDAMDEFDHKVRNGYPVALYAIDGVSFREVAIKTPFE